ncbi:MAG: chemotaxis protein CheA [Pseudomonadota bacterium]|nr:chemotaxis protein CheA [Pseudomonadota bacterium]
MSIDMQQFQQTFFEESLEGLDVMESGLLAMDPSALDAEAINAIFRAAHSIKGGAGTFGFEPISQFTHVVETLLDDLRSGARQADPALVDLLLRSVDSLRAMFDDAQAGAEIDVARHHAVQRELLAVLEATPVADDDDQDVTPALAVAGWRIAFRPHADLFSTGNDPLHVFRELAGMGEFTATPDYSELPDLAAIDPTLCYGHWVLDLLAPVPETQVRDAFAWIEDECDLALTPQHLVDDPELGTLPKLAEVPEHKAPPSRSNPVHPPAASSTLRVGVDKIDTLINLVGELVITQSMLNQAGHELDPVHHERLIAGLETLARNTRDLQDAVLSTRMVVIDSVFKRFPRVVRDVATQLGKQVELHMEGEGTELDRSVTEKIVDPLTHIVRNSIDHGIESPERREAAGKPAKGHITLKAAHEGGFIVIEVMDDGAGLNRQRILDKARQSGLAVSDDMSDADVWQLLFAPGFSTAEAVTDLSGRGVGMDVVKRNIVGLGGQVTLSSQAGQGTRVEIRLPLTLAILDGMLVGVGDETYVIPLNVVCESLQPAAADIKRITGQAEMVRVRGEYIPILRLHQAFGVAGAQQALAASVLVIVESEGKRVALQVDELLGHQQVVIKNLEEHYGSVFGVSGATILGNGRVSLILDAGELAATFEQVRAA